MVRRPPECLDDGCEGRIDLRLEKGAGIVDVFSTKAMKREPRDGRNLTLWASGKAFKKDAASSQPPSESLWRASRPLLPKQQNALDNLIFSRTQRSFSPQS